LNETFSPLIQARKKDGVGGSPGCAVHAPMKFERSIQKWNLTGKYVAKKYQLGDKILGGRMRKTARGNFEPGASVV